jgi:acyl-CoA hydrolase
MTNNISFSRVETCMIMEPIHGNPYGNVHGGELMRIMDNTAGLAALKHAKGTVVTARVDEIVFHKPIHIGDIVTCIGQVAYVGKSSIQVMVSIVVHELTDYSQQETAMTAFFTMVHLVDNKPAKVPELIVTSKEEEELYKLGERKYYEIKSKYRGQ